MAKGQLQKTMRSPQRQAHIARMEQRATCPECGEQAVVEECMAEATRELYFDFSPPDEEADPDGDLDDYDSFCGADLAVHDIYEGENYCAACSKRLDDWEAIVAASRPPARPIA